MAGLFVGLACVLRHALLHVGLCCARCVSRFPAARTAAPARPAVRLFELRIGPHQRGWVQKVLVESFEVEGAALEFGGDRRCADKEGAQAGNVDGSAATL